MKKGQVTLFIIIGIVLFLTSMTIFYYDYENNEIPIAIEKNIDNYAKSISDFIGSCSENAIIKGVWDVGLKETPLKEEISDKLLSCINSGLDVIEQEGITTKRGEFNVDITINNKAIVLDISYPIVIVFNEDSKELDKFNHRISLIKDYNLELNQNCQLKKEFGFFTPDKSGKILIPKGTKITDQYGNCVNKIGVEVIDTLSPLSVFKVGYDFKPDGTNLLPYFEFWTKYNQDDFEKVKSAYSPDYSLSEEGIRIAFYDTGNYTDRQNPSGRLGNVFRPYEDFSQSVDILNNIVYARPNHFSNVFTLTGCSSSDTTKYTYINLFATVNGQIVNNTVVCSGQSATKEYSYTVSGDYSSCQSTSSVEVYYYGSTGDSLISLDGDTSNSALTSQGVHAVEITIQDSDQQPVTYMMGDYCAFVNLEIKTTGVGIRLKGWGVSLDAPWVYPSARNFYNFQGELVSVGTTAPFGTNPVTFGSDNTENSENLDNSDSSGGGNYDTGTYTGGTTTTTPSTPTTTTQNTCSDGTVPGSCSLAAPNYCNLNNQLVNDCTKCGCPTGTTCINNACIGTCSDSTPTGQCSSSHPGQFCDNGNLVPSCNDKCSGCPSGYTCVATGACLKLCSDGTVSGQCSTTKPRFCQDGILINNCITCSCPTGSGTTCKIWRDSPSDPLYNTCIDI